MENNYVSLVNYENPPVIEVVCGILFEPLKNMLTPHLGLLWQEFLPEYSSCQEVPPLSPIIERFDEVRDPMRIEYLELPPIPRIWFKHRDENGIIQVERNRFIYNWRKVRESDEYPRYQNVIEIFHDHLHKFKEFLNKNDLGEIAPLQYEMTYVNHVPQGQGWESMKDIGNIFPDFAFRDKKRFLPFPELINWKTSFLLPDNLGRFHVTIRRSVIPGESRREILSLESTVRGIGTDKSIEGMNKWFNLAHEWIVYGFADLTGEEVQKSIWLRQD